MQAHNRSRTLIAGLAIIWAVVLACSLAWNLHALREQVVAFADAEAKAHLKQDLAFRTWSSEHGGLYVPMSPEYLTADKQPLTEARTADGKILVLQNPAWSLREIKERQGRLFGQLARITAKEYLSGGNKPDAWELKALNIVERTREDFSEVVEMDGKSFLRRMQPMVLEVSCMKCHPGPNLRVGQIHGGTDIAIPLAEKEEAAGRIKRLLLTTHIVLFLAGTGLLLIIALKLHKEECLEHEYQAELELRAHTDSLTELLNRRHFFELADMERAKALRYSRDLSLIMLDIDHFKAINDTYGHSTGDEALKQLARSLTESVREIDHVCRMGGEEFAILLVESPQHKALEVAERIRNSVASLRINRTQGTPINFTVSLGVAALENGDNFDTLVSKADKNLYKAKETGRNKVVG